MLCSSCSRNVKPVVAFDIDGVLGDYHRHFTEFCLRYWAHTKVGPQPYDGSIEFEEWLGLNKIEYREAKLAYRQGGTKRWMPQFRDAQAVVRAVRNDGAEVWIATTRPWQRLDNIDPDTREWLRRSRIDFDGLLYGDDKYNQLSDAVDPERIVAVVDDLAYQCRIAQKLGLHVYQVHRAHNLADRFYPGGTLEDIGLAIQVRIETWKAHHGRSDRVPQGTGH